MNLLIHKSDWLIVRFKSFALLGYWNVGLLMAERELSILGQLRQMPGVGVGGLAGESCWWQESQSVPVWRSW